MIALHDKPTLNRRTARRRKAMTFCTRIQLERQMQYPDRNLIQQKANAFMRVSNALTANDRYQLSCNGANLTPKCVNFRRHIAAFLCAIGFALVTNVQIWAQGRIALDFEEFPLGTTVAGVNGNTERRGVVLYTGANAGGSIVQRETAEWKTDGTSGPSFLTVGGAGAFTLLLHFLKPVSFVSIDFIAGPEEISGYYGFLSVPGVTKSYGGSSYWNSYSAVGPIEELKLRGFNGSIAIDNLSYTQIPEPKTTWLALFGSCALLLRVRRFYLA
jgi:hypothetical protein